MKLSQVTLQAVQEAFDKLFVVDLTDPTLILQRGQVSRAVAAYLGVRYSGHFAKFVVAVALAAGAVPTICRWKNYKYLRARALTPLEANKISRAYRRSAHGYCSDGQMVEAAKELRAK